MPSHEGHGAVRVQIGVPTRATHVQRGQVGSIVATSTRIVVLCLAGLIGCTSTPEYVGMTPQEGFAYAQRKFDEGDYKDAIEALEQIAASSPDFERMPEVRLLMADAFYRDGDFLTAVSEYTRVLDRYVNTPQGPAAGLGICRSYVELAPIPQRDQTFTEQALTACENTARDYPGTEHGTEAQALATDMFERLAERDFQIGESYFRLKFYDSARIYYEDVVAQYPTTPSAPRSLARLVELFTVIQYDDLAEESRQRLLTEYPDSPSALQLKESGETRATGG